MTCYLEPVPDNLRQKWCLNRKGMRTEVHLSIDPALPECPDSVNKSCNWTVDGRNPVELLSYYLAVIFCCDADFYVFWKWNILNYFWDKSQ